MASAIPQQPQASLETRPYFCHQCSHQWQKSATALFQCPRCNEGFIEEVTADFEPRSPLSLPSPRSLSPPSPEIPLQFFNILNEFSMLNDRINHNERGRGRARSSTNLRDSRSATSSRGRSPQDRTARNRISVVLGTARGSDANDIQIHIGTERPGRGSILFPIDNIMNTLFAAAVIPQPFMTDSQLEEIPKATITALNVEEQSQCAICFEDYKLNEDDVRKLPPCAHLFHEKCIFPWLKTNATCPVCRARMPNVTEDDNSDIDEDSLFNNLEDLSRFFRHHRRENRTGESSSANNNENSRRTRRLPIPPIPPRIRTRSTRQMPAFGDTVRFPSDLTRPSTRATTNAAAEEQANEVPPRFLLRNLRRPTTGNASAEQSDEVQTRRGPFSRTQPVNRSPWRRPVPSAATIVQTDETPASRGFRRRVNMRRLPPSTYGESSRAGPSTSSALQNTLEEAAAARRSISPTVNLVRVDATEFQRESSEPIAGFERMRTSPRPVGARVRRFESVAPSSLADMRFNTTFLGRAHTTLAQPSTSGVTTRTRSRQTRTADFEISPAHSSNTSLVTISDDDSEISIEPPRRRRRLITGEDD